MRSPDAESAPALLLTVPGLCCSGPDHWQSAWEAERADCRRIELGLWDDPRPEAWSAGIAEAVARLDGAAVLVAHSLGCHAVALWAAGDPDAAARVRGALLVAPPDVERSDDVRVARFPFRAAPLPFRSLLVASRDDPWSSFARSRRMADAWGAQLIDAGPAGHLNADSGLGGWEEGQRLAEALAEPGS